MVAVTSAIQVLLMVGAPAALVWWLVRRGASIGLIGAGALTFVGSQVVHIPLNIGLTWLVNQSFMPQIPRAHAPIFNAVVLGFTAGLCEEWARYLVLRAWMKKARSFREAIAFGAGHGGVESAILGALVALTAFSMVLTEAVDPALLGVPPEAMGEVEAQLEAWWSMPWYHPLLGGGERLMAITLHLSFSALVMRAVIVGQTRLVWLAVLAHMGVDALVVYVMATWGPLASEGALLAAMVMPAAILVLAYRASARDGTLERAEEEGESPT